MSEQKAKKRISDGYGDSDSAIISPTERESQYGSLPAAAVERRTGASMFLILGLAAVALFVVANPSTGARRKRRRK